MGEVVTPVALRMSLPLGQTGVAAYAHTPRRVEVGVVEVARPLLLVPRRALRREDGAPATVERLRLRMSGVADYMSGLYPDGPTTAPGVTPEGATARMPLPAFDRWVLVEWITVRWGAGRPQRGFALWRRPGRGRWAPGVAWWCEVDGWRFGRNSEVP